MLAFWRGLFFAWCPAKTTKTYKSYFSLIWLNLSFLMPNEMLWTYISVTESMQWRENVPQVGNFLSVRRYLNIWPKQYCLVRHSWKIENFLQNKTSECYKSSETPTAFFLELFLLLYLSARICDWYLLGCQIYRGGTPVREKRWN